MGFPEYNLTQGNHLCKVTGKIRFAFLFVERSEAEEGRRRVKLALSVSALETKGTNSRNMSRLILVAKSKAKLFSCETRD